MERSKLLSGFTLLMAVSLGMMSCLNRGGGVTTAEKSADFDTVQVVKRSHLEGDSTNPYCDIRVDFVYPITSTGVSPDTLQLFFIENMLGTSYNTLPPLQAVEAYVENYIENYSYDAETYRDAVNDMIELNALIPGIDLTDSEHNVNESFYSYYETLSNSIIYNRYGVISFQIEQSNNKGGATSYVSYHNYVIDVNSGQQVLENELFRAGYDQALQNLIIASLLEENSVKSVDELEDLGFFGIREIIPNKNFLLTDQGIIYTYNKGEYSAYQLDAPEVFIPYTAIRSLLRDYTPAAKLADLK